MLGSVLGSNIFRPQCFVRGTDPGCQNTVCFATTIQILKLPYSLTFINLTALKPYASQILSYKIFSFCAQVLKIHVGANDASGKMLQYALSIFNENSGVVLGDFK